MRPRGFALIAALWLLVAISVAALAFAGESRVRRLAAANVREDAQARAASRAALETTRARLVGFAAVRGGTTDPWADADSLLDDTLRLGDERAVVRVRDVGAAINLNLAEEDALRRLFGALRMDAGDADRLAQTIMDWRDADDLHRARGAERDTYERDGAAVLPRNGPFHTLDELRHVRGVTPEIFARVSPYLTLAGTGQVNLSAAPRPVLLALPGIGEEAAAAILRLRGARSHLANVSDLGSQLSGPARATFTEALPYLLTHTSLETRELEARADGWVADGRVHASTEGLLVLSRGLVFLVWSRTE